MMFCIDLQSICLFLFMIFFSFSFILCYSNRAIINIKSVILLNRLKHEKSMAYAHCFACGARKTRRNSDIRCYCVSARIDVNVFGRCFRFDSSSLFLYHFVSWPLNVCVRASLCECVSACSFFFSCFI